MCSGLSLVAGPGSRAGADLRQIPFHEGLQLLNRLEVGDAPKRHIHPLARLRVAAPARPAAPDTGIAEAAEFDILPLAQRLRDPAEQDVDDDLGALLRLGSPPRQRAPTRWNMSRASLNWAARSRPARHRTAASVQPSRSASWRTRSPPSSWSSAAASRTAVSSVCVQRRAIVSARPHSSGRRSRGSQPRSPLRSIHDTWFRDSTPAVRMTRAQPQPWAASVVAPECPAVNNPADARHGYGRIDGGSEPAPRAPYLEMAT